jgi:hypothetical protein
MKFVRVSFTEFMQRSMSGRKTGIDKGKGKVVPVLN